MKMDRKRAHIYIEGRVQGVYFRATTREMARKLGLGGWIRNLNDGRVEAVFEGPQKSIEKIIEWCWEGSINSEVHNLNYKEENPQNIRDFRIINSPNSEDRAIRKFGNTNIKTIPKTGVKKIIGTLPHPHDERIYRKLGDLLNGIKTANSSSLPKHYHVWIYWKGFNENLYHLYDLESIREFDNYFSDYGSRCTKEVNNNPRVLDDKELFYNYIRVWYSDKVLPNIFGYVREGKFKPNQSNHDKNLYDLVLDKNKIVLKGTAGKGGDNVYVGMYADNELSIINKDGTEFDADSILNELDRAIVMEYSQQADYINQVFPRSANTIRLIGINPDDDEPFIPTAVQRIGTEQSAPLDNFSSNGLASNIDMETGELSVAVQKQENGRQFYEKHPVSNKQIKGVEVPGWNSINSELLDIMESLPGLKYVGWDIIVTNPGEFVIIEGNNNPNPRSSQVFQPLMEEKKVRTFFETNGIPT